jgi:G:T/U-mismatch repair DNA glycosylase
MIEHHPLEPFIPEHTNILMLGSFPPKRERWSMEFFYPNWINDMWRIMGIIFYADKHYFEVEGSKIFDCERIMEFCSSKGIALYDSATEVKRLKDNASDKFLEVVTPTDIKALLSKAKGCKAIVTTGQKASDIVAEMFGCAMPAIGSHTIIDSQGVNIEFWRMPSSSRAYPLSLEKKAEIYRKMLTEVGML